MLSLFGISIQEKALFYENTANLLEGGVTLVMALRGLENRLENGKLKECVNHLLFFIEGGDAVNIAMRKLPNYFHEREIAIVESGEQTGMIVRSFQSLAADLRSQEKLRNDITSAMTYPFIIIFFLILALIVVMVYVVPQLIPVINSVSGELPFTTKSLIWVSLFLKGNIVTILLFLVASFLVFLGYTRTEFGKYWWDGLKMRFPAIGNVYKNYLIVRVMSTLHLLISSGVSIVKTLRMTGESSGNTVIEKLFYHVSDDIAHGQKISSSMMSKDAGHTFFTADIIQMIESAERTSTLDSVTEKIGVQYRREVDNSLNVMVKFIEPVALLAAGIFVLWFAIAIFSAIMQIVSLAGN